VAAVAGTCFILVGTAGNDGGAVGALFRGVGAFCGGAFSIAGSGDDIGVVVAFAGGALIIGADGALFIGAAGAASPPMSIKASSEMPCCIAAFATISRNFATDIMPLLTDPPVFGGDLYEADAILFGGVLGAGEDGTTCADDAVFGASSALLTIYIYI